MTCSRCGGPHPSQNCNALQIKRDAAIVRETKRHRDGMTTRELMDKLRIKRDTIQPRLTILRDSGQIVLIGSGVFARWAAPQHVDHVRETLIAASEVRAVERRERELARLQYKKQQRRRDVDVNVVTQVRKPAAAAKPTSRTVRDVFAFADLFRNLGPGV